MVGAIAAALLGAVFLFSGVAKLARVQLWRAQASELGVPATIAAPLPFVEIVLGAWLVVQLARPLAAWIAAVVLLAFTGLLALRIAHGRRPPCACFGALSSRPIGWIDVLRNLALIAVAIVAITS